MYSFKIVSNGFPPKINFGGLSQDYRFTVTGNLLSDSKPLAVTIEVPLSFVVSEMELIDKTLQEISIPMLLDILSSIIQSFAQSDVLSSVEIEMLSVIEKHCSSLILFPCTVEAGASMIQLAQSEGIQNIYLEAALVSGRPRTLGELFPLVLNDMWASDMKDLWFITI